MRRGRPAGSAEAVAALRAIESARPPSERLFHDPYAERFLTTGGRAMVALCSIPILGTIALAVADRLAFGQRAFVLARTALIDQALEAALARGVAQVVILGAGYDSRAYRIAGIERALVFEVDHPDTQALKRARLARIDPRGAGHVRFVAIDFNRQSLRERLRDAGFREGAPCFVIWEGVTEYLDAEAVQATLRFLAACAAPGSELAFTYLDRDLLDGTREFRGGRSHLAMMRRTGEPFTFGIAPPELGAYLAERGFDLLDDAGGSELSSRCFRPHHRRERANGYQRLAIARVSGSPPRSPDA